MSNQVHRKFEWELDESQNNDDIEESNKRLKRCVTHLQAELNHTVLMNQKAEIERSNESIKQNKIITQEKRSGYKSVFFDHFLESVIFGSAHGISLFFGIKFFLFFHNSKSCVCK